MENIKNIIKNEVANILSESGLSRIQQHVLEHDCAIITAFRKDPTDRTMCVDETPIEVAPKAKPIDINKINNRDLKAVLLGSGFGVTKVEGSYIEGFKTPQAVEVKEDSLFVVNLKDDPGFVSKIASLGEKYCQDSVLILPKGGKGVCLLGTNKAEFPGYGNEISLGDLTMGKEAEFMTRIKNRPFIVGEQLETYESLPRLQRMAVRALAKKSE